MNGLTLKNAGPPSQVAVFNPKSLLTNRLRINRRAQVPADVGNAYNSGRIWSLFTRKLPPVQGQAQDLHHFPGDQGPPVFGDAALLVIGRGVKL